MKEMLLKILPGLIVALFASYLSAKWALKKFLSEKWWERKSTAYTEIIDALYDMIRYYEIKKEDYGQGTGLSKKTETELKNQYVRAYWKIKKVTDIGAFVISSEAQSILKELRDRPRLKWEENPSFDIYEDDFNAHRTTLDKVVKAAKLDLKAQKD